MKSDVILEHPCPVLCPSREQLVPSDPGAPSLPGRAGVTAQRAQKKGDLNAVPCKAEQNRGGGYHDEALGQASAGQEVDDAQPFGKPQVSEGRWLQCDGVGCGRPYS